jgi:hypothetical protein
MELPIQLWSAILDIYQSHDESFIIMKTKPGQGMKLLFSICYDACKTYNLTTLWSTTLAEKNVKSILSNRTTKSIVYPYTISILYP